MPEDQNNSTAPAVAPFDVSPLPSLLSFINRAPGLSRADYDIFTRAYWADRQSITRAKRRALAAYYRADAFTYDAETMRAAFSAFSGRLAWNGETLHYTAGQMRALEYRDAAATVLERYCEMRADAADASPVEQNAA